MRSDWFLLLLNIGHLCCLLSSLVGLFRSSLTRLNPYFGFLLPGCCFSRKTMMDAAALIPVGVKINAATLIPVGVNME